jgi:hypothetical protein
VFDDIWDPEGGVKEEHSAAALLPIELPKGKGRLKSYAKDWEEVVIMCTQPNIQGLHSAFVSPESMSVTTKLFPLFGNSKLAMSNEILIPGATEWNTSSTRTVRPSQAWEERSNKLFWRGLPTKSRDPSRYWTRLQRERLVSMLNATHVEIAEASMRSGNESTVGVGYAGNFRLLPANDYELQSLTNGEFAEWVNSWADAAFISLNCAAEDEERECGGMGEYFSVAQQSTLEQERNAKFAIILDGSSSSDDQLTQTLSSGKVALHASIYCQWYDNRIVPWVHYIPLDNTLADLYGVMEYFLGTEVSEEARFFPHAKGEVQKHEHRLKTPGMDVEEKTEEPEKEDDSGEDLDDHGSMTGNEPHDFQEARDTRQKCEDGHDQTARKIAEASKEWAGKVFRREDMLVYVYRLLLEYARVLDDRRERLGFVEDLVED